MTNEKCVLDIMKNKGYIKIITVEKDPKQYYIKITKKIKDENIRREMYEKIYAKLKESNKYIFNNEEDNLNPNFIEKKSVIDFAENFIKSGKEKSIFYQPNYICDFINKSFPDIKIENHYITNCKIKRERLEQEQKTDKEALELLNNIL